MLTKENFGVEELKQKIRDLAGDEPSYFVLDDLGLHHRQIEFNFKNINCHDGTFMVYLKDGIDLIPFNYEYRDG